MTALLPEDIQDEVFSTWRIRRRTNNEQGGICTLIDREWLYGAIQVKSKASLAMPSHSFFVASERLFWDSNEHTN